MIRIDETICAPATSGGGAIAIIRMSGKEAISICNKVFVPSDVRINLLKQPGYTIVYGEIRDGEEIVDDVLVSIFIAPHSYTGEDSVEISCHASRYIQQKIMELLSRNGAAPAQPGEFTQRAFLNGKMDLSQAEAVADLIASESRSSHRIAINQMRGAFSDEIRVLRADLLHFASLIELELDFGEEDVEFADRNELTWIVTKVLDVSRNLTSSFSLGNAVKYGIPVVITGRTNTGKSTLLNYLLREERAIVSDIPGTTRDAIEDTVVIEGIQFRFTDTAGLRSTEDVIENLGIKKAHEKIKSASIVIFLADISQDHNTINEDIVKLKETITRSDKKLIILVNKVDADTTRKLQALKNNIYVQAVDSLLFISAKTGEGIDVLKRELLRTVDIEMINSEGVILSNVRHYNALSQVTQSLERVLEGLRENVPEDLIATDIRQAIHYLGEITGEITSDEILANIFRNFCIGK